MPLAEVRGELYAFRFDGRLPKNFFHSNAATFNRDRGIRANLVRRCHSSYGGTFPISFGRNGAAIHRAHLRARRGLTGCKHTALEKRATTAQTNFRRSIYLYNFRESGIGLLNPRSHDNVGAKLILRDTIYNLTPHDRIRTQIEREFQHSQIASLRIKQIIKRAFTLLIII